MKQTLLTLTLCTATLISFATAATQTEDFDCNGAFTLTFVLDWNAEKNTTLRYLKDNTIDHEIITLFSLTDNAGNSKLSLVVDDWVRSGFFTNPDTGKDVFGKRYTAHLQSVINGGEGVKVLSEAFDKTINADGANSEIAALTVSYNKDNRTVGYYLRLSYDKYEEVDDINISKVVKLDSTADLSGLMKLTYDDALVIGSVVRTERAVVDATDAAKLNADAIEKERPKPTPSVPEPATATLSLLALAGLAARRRRK